MKKYIAILAGFCTLLSACEEVYNANLSEVENLLVIEALLTNDASKNYVKIAKTQNFYSRKGQQRVAGTTVTISDKSGNSYSLPENSTGYFITEFSAVPGESYRIRVEAEGEVYESGYETMPPVVSVDSIYVQPETTIAYIYNDLGEPTATEITGMTVFADLSLTEDLRYYRFSLPRTMEYVVPPPPPTGSPKPGPPWEQGGSPESIWGWMNFRQSGVFPIHGPATYGSESVLKKRKLLFLRNTVGTLLSASRVIDGAYMVGWIVDMSVFGMNEKSYKFYESVNDQLKAEGKLFDAVYAQLTPNFTCITNPGKKALGYFEVSSYAYRRFFVMALAGSDHTYFHYVEHPWPIPVSGEIEGSNPPVFWENR